MTLVFMLGLALLFFVGFTACQKDGMEAETALASAEGQTTSNRDSDGEVTTRSSGTCECEYKIYSINGNFGTGNHLEMMARTESNFCSPGCMWAEAIYGPCLLNLYGNSCTFDLSNGSVSFTFPTRWIPFNCLIPSGANFDKRLYLSQVPSNCSPNYSGTSGQIVYGLRCKENPNISCSSEWQDSTATNFTISNSGNLTFEIGLTGDCGCSPTIN